MPFDMDCADRDFRDAPLFDRRYETCSQALAELEKREAWSRETGRSVAHLCAVMDPSVVRVMLMSRAHFLDCCEPEERGLVSYADTAHELRVILKSPGERSGSTLLADLRPAIAKLEAAHGQ